MNKRKAIKRSSWLVIRVHPEELVKVHEDARAAGASMSNHVRTRIGLPPFGKAKKEG